MGLQGVPEHLPLPYFRNQAQLSETRLNQQHHRPRLDKQCVVIIPLWWHVRTCVSFLNTLVGACGTSTCCLLDTMSLWLHFNKGVPGGRSKDLGQNLSQPVQAAHVKSYLYRALEFFS